MKNNLNQIYAFFQFFSPYKASYSSSSKGDDLFFIHLIIATAKLKWIITCSSECENTDNDCDDCQSTKSALLFTSSRNVIEVLVVWTEAFLLVFIQLKSWWTLAFIGLRIEFEVITAITFTFSIIGSFFPILICITFGTGILILASQAPRTYTTAWKAFIIGWNVSSRRTT